MSVVVNCLHQFPYTSLVSRCSFACRTNDILQLSTVVKLKDNAENSLLFFRSHDDSSKPVASTSSEPVNNKTAYSGRR